METKTINGDEEVRRTEQLRKLLEAVNEAARTSRQGWIFFLSVMVYLGITALGISDRDILLNSPVTLPILRVDFSLKEFLSYSPPLILLLHIGLLYQHSLLREKVRRFDNEVKDSAILTLRYELSTYFFVQLYAGRQADNHHKGIAKSFAILTLFILPPSVILLIFFSGQFLLEGVALGVIALAWIGNFAALYFYMWNEDYSEESFTENKMMDMVFIYIFSSIPMFVPLFKTTNFLGPPTPIHLSVKNTDLVPDTIPETKDVSIRLRGRQLPYIELDGSDLHRADFSEAYIAGASFKGARLAHTKFKSAIGYNFDPLRKHETVRFDEADLRQADFSLSNFQGASFEGAQLGSAIFNSRIYKKKVERTNLRYASFGKSNLDHTEFEQADMQGAGLSGAQLKHVNMKKALMQGASMFYGLLYKTDMSRANLNRMKFSWMNLIESNWTNLSANAGSLEDSIIFGTKFDEARMHGFDFSDSLLLNDSMYKTDLQGANLSHTLLFGIEAWWNTNLSGANFTGAKIWNCEPPDEKYLKHVDLSQISIAPPETEYWSINYKLDKIHDKTLAKKLKKKINALLTDRKIRRWKRSKAYRMWKRLKKRHTPKNRAVFIEKRTRFLVDLICKSKADQNALAHNIIKGGIVSKAKKYGDETGTFLADPALFRLLLKKCKPKEPLDKESRKKLAELAEKYKAWRIKVQKTKASKSGKKK